MIKEGAIGFGFSEACLPVLLTAAFSPRLHVVFPLDVRIPVSLCVTFHKDNGHIGFLPSLMALFELNHLFESSLSKYS